MDAYFIAHVVHNRQKRNPKRLSSGNKCVRELDGVPQEKIIFPVHFSFEQRVTPKTLNISYRRNAFVPPPAAAFSVSPKFKSMYLYEA